MLKESPVFIYLFFLQAHSSFLCPYDRIGFKRITERKNILYIPKYELTEKPLKANKLW